MDHNISCIADRSTELLPELPIFCGVQPEEEKMEQNVTMVIHPNSTLQRLTSRKRIHRKAALISQNKYTALCFLVFFCSLVIGFGTNWSTEHAVLIHICVRLPAGYVRDQLKHHTKIKAFEVISMNRSNINHALSAKCCWHHFTFLMPIYLDDI